MGKSNSANNQRSNAKNPNNAAYKASADNKSNQMNSNNSAYKSSRSSDESDSESEGGF